MTERQKAFWYKINQIQECNRQLKEMKSKTFIELPTFDVVNGETMAQLHTLVCKAMGMVQDVRANLNGVKSLGKEENVAND